MGSAGSTGNGKGSPLSTDMAGRASTGHSHFGLEQLRLRSEMFAEFLSLFDAAPAVIIVSDIDGKILFWNRGAESKYGFSRKQALGSDWIGLLKTRFPGDYARIRVGFLESGRWEGELVQEASDGRSLVIAASIAVRRDESGAPVALLLVGNDISAASRMEEALAQSEKRYRDFVEFLPEGMAIIADGRIAYVNPAGAAMFGLVPERAIDRDVLDFVPAGTRAETAGLMRAVIENGRPLLMHSQKALRVDGKDVDVELNAAPVMYNGRRAIQIVFRDVSLRKYLELAREDAEKRVREERERLQGIIDHMPLMMFAVDTGGSIVAWNRECERVTGYSGAEIVGNPAAFELLFPDPASRTRFQEKWAGRNGYFRDWEWGICCKDGRERVISWSNISSRFPLPGWRIWAFGADITERKIAEEKLSMAHRQLLDMIEFLPDPTFVINQERRVVAWNQALEQMTGVNKADIIGKGPEAYALPFYGCQKPMLVDCAMGMADETMLGYDRVTREHGLLSAEIFLPNLNGSKGAFIQVRATPLLDKQGMVVGAIQTLRDISEQKAGEAILKKDKDAFERLLKERTRQLLKVQAELADSRHLSEIGMLAATVAHELRNPLAAIRMGVYNIKKRNGGPQLNQHLGIIEKKIMESDQIINNLLNYSRIKTPMFERVKLRELVEEVIASVGARFYGWEVRVRLKDEARGVSVLADPLQLKEMLANILSNAYEAFPGKTGEISVFIKRGKNAFGISVSDNGVGISAENLRKISRPFFTTKSKGTGLGLAVCRQMATMHGGKIGFKSIEGKGTTVSLSLPIRGGKQI